jgi:hypothetical protein
MAADYLGFCVGFEYIGSRGWIGVSGWEVSAVVVGSWSYEL